MTVGSRAVLPGQANGCKPSVNEKDNWKVSAPPQKGMPDKQNKLNVVSCKEKESTETLLGVLVTRTAIHPSALLRNVLW